jgi:hypothetical protein
MNCLKVAFIASTIGFLVSCKKSGDIKPEELHQEYKMSFDESDNYTVFSASIRCEKSNGRKMKLSKNAKLFLNNTALTGKKKFDNRQDGWIAGGTFRFENGSGTSYENTISTANQIYDDGQYYYYKHFQDYIYWTGLPIGPGETITVYFRGKDNDGKDISASESNSNSGQNYISLSKSFFDNFQDDSNITYNFVRAKRIYVGNFSQAGGSIISSYESSEQSGYLND